MNETCCVCDKMFGKYHRGNSYTPDGKFDGVSGEKCSENRWKRDDFVRLMENPPEENSAPFVTWFVQ